jgi:hypothetical protein
MLLFIVSRDQSTLYAALRHEFGTEREVSVVLDRRVGERRRNGGPPGDGERRQSDRRVHMQVEASLRSLGWAIIQSDR